MQLNNENDKKKPEGYFTVTKSVVQEVPVADWATIAAVEGPTLKHWKEIHQRNVL